MPPAVLKALKAQLQQAEGFQSYKAIQRWLSQTYQLSIPYSTGHRIVRYRLKAKLKVGRKSHVKKDPQQIEGFKAELKEQLRDTATPFLS